MPLTCCKDDIHGSDLRRSRANSSGWLWLMIALAAILVLWLVVLPWLATQPPIRRHIEFLEQRQIDPSAMFYTELEAMPALRTKVSRIREDHPASFW